jgi:hypothetical protein
VNGLRVCFASREIVACPARELSPREIAIPFAATKSTTIHFFGSSLIWVQMRESHAKDARRTKSAALCVVQARKTSGSSVHVSRQHPKRRGVDARLGNWQVSGA